MTRGVGSSKLRDVHGRLLAAIESAAAPLSGWLTAHVECCDPQAPVAFDDAAIAELTAIGDATRVAPLVALLADELDRAHRVHVSRARLCRRHPKAHKHTHNRRCRQS